MDLCVWSSHSDCTAVTAQQQTGIFFSVREKVLDSIMWAKGQLDFDDFCAGFSRKTMFEHMTRSFGDGAHETKERLAQTNQMVARKP